MSGGLLAAVLVVEHDGVDGRSAGTPVDRDDRGAAVDERGQVRAVAGRGGDDDSGLEPLAIFYNVPNWERAGLSEADIPTTWEQLLDIGDKRRAKGGGAGLVFETDPGYYQNFTWYCWMWQGGGEVLDKDGNVTFDSKAGQRRYTEGAGAVELVR